MRLSNGRRASGGSNISSKHGVARKRGAARRVVAATLETLEARQLLASWQPLAHAPPGPIGIANLLSDGTVLVHREADNTSKIWYKLTPDSTGSYVNGTWSTLAQGTLERWSFPSNVLKDGRVF